MVSKKSFTLLVDTGKVPIFTVISIIFEQDCREKLVKDLRTVYTYRLNERAYGHNQDTPV